MQDFGATVARDLAGGDRSETYLGNHDDERVVRAFLASAITVYMGSSNQRSRNEALKNLGRACPSTVAPRCFSQSGR